VNLKQVIEPTDFVAIEVVDVFEDVFVIDARVAQKLSDMRPVFLLDKEWDIITKSSNAKR